MPRQTSCTSLTTATPGRHTSRRRAGRSIIPLRATVAYWLIPLVGLLLLSAGERGVAAADRPNVLFLAVDDLRPQLGCYGHAEMHSPHIDDLAHTGVMFTRAYCMVPTCGASRASLMTGLRPSRGRFVNYLTLAEKDAPGITTLNTHFKNHGYYTISNGKVFHHPRDNGHGWSEPAWRPRGVPTYRQQKSRQLAAEQERGSRRRGPAFESADVPDTAYADGQVAAKAIADLRRLAKMDRPFFLAVGFFKPHLPFVAPQRYWELYDHEQIRLPHNYHPPQHAPKEAIHNFGELRAYAGIPQRGPVSDETARNLIHGYYACVSYTDRQIGKVVDELDLLGLAENTIVVLWSDHGWNLGEHTLWCKHCCFETSMQVPLIVRAPGIPEGQRVDALTELIDLYPSLCELAGLPLPPHLQGRSVAGLLKNPQAEGEPTAIGRFRSGDTIRTARYRFTRYSDAQGGFLSHMLYDHQSDPHENLNIAGFPRHAELVSELTRRLQAGMGRDAD